MKTVNGCAEGGDKRSKGAAETLSMMIYRSFHVGDKEKVKEAIHCSEIILKTTPRTRKELQMDKIENIIEIVAKKIQCTAYQNGEAKFYN